MVLPPLDTLPDGLMQYNPTALARAVAGDYFSRFNGGWLQRIDSVKLTLTSERALTGPYLSAQPPLQWLEPGVYLDCSIGGTRSRPQRFVTVFTLLPGGVIEHAASTTATDEYVLKLMPSIRAGFTELAKLSPNRQPTLLNPTATEDKRCYYCAQPITSEDAQHTANALSLLTQFVPARGVERAYAPFTKGGASEVFLGDHPVLCPTHARELIERMFLQTVHPKPPAQLDALLTRISEHHATLHRATAPLFVPVRARLHTDIETTFNTLRVEMAEPISDLAVRPDGFICTEFYCELCQGEVLL